MIHVWHGRIKFGRNILRKSLSISFRILSISKLTIAGRFSLAHKNMCREIERAFVSFRVFQNSHQIWIRLCKPRYSPRLSDKPINLCVAASPFLHVVNVIICYIEHHDKISFMPFIKKRERAKAGSESWYRAYVRVEICAKSECFKSIFFDMFWENWWYSR